MNSIKKYYLSEVIYMCNNCNKIDIKTYATYIKKNNNYILDKKYKECPDCGYIELLEE